MAITDLTNTTWQFKQELDVYYFGVTQLWNINFINNNNYYTMLSIDETWSDFGLAYVESLGQYIDVYDYVDGWYNNNYDIYKTITISGGTDVTNTDLISWLQINAEQVLSKPTFYRVTDLELNSIANVIREITGKSESLTYPDEFIDEINSINRGSCNINVIDYAARTYSTIDADVGMIRHYGFYRYSRLTTASFPKCTSIGSYAFNTCSSLITASFPKCTFIGDYAFSYCNSLTTAFFPECTFIGSSAFYQCNKLTTLYAPECTTIGTMAFALCYSLTSISFSKCTSIGSSAFSSCARLTDASFSKVSYIGNSAFRSCYKLISFNLMGVSQVPTLVDSIAFSSTPIAGYTTSTGGQYGSIYVPSSLYDAFASATNWTYFSSRMVSI